MGKVTGGYPGWHVAPLAAWTWLWMIVTFGFAGAEITCRSCHWQVQLQEQRRQQPPQQGLLMHLRTGRESDEARRLPAEERGERQQPGHGEEAADPAPAGEGYASLEPQSPRESTNLSDEAPTSLRLSPLDVDKLATSSKSPPEPPRSSGDKERRSAPLGSPRQPEADRTRSQSRKPRGAPAARAPQLESRDRAPAERQQQQQPGKATRFGLEELKLTSTTFALTGDSAHNQAMVHWSGHNSSVILILTKLYDYNLGSITESSLWRSTDYGTTYEKLNDKVGLKTILSYLYVCPTNKRKIMLLTDPEIESSLLISSDEGATYQKYRLNFYIHSMLFHPKQEDWILAYSQDQKLYSSVEFGRRWLLLQENVTPNRFY